jgi:cysteine desulfuration protein SufE
MTKQSQLIQDLLFVPDVQERLSAVVEGSWLQKTAPHEDELLVQGCQTKVWVQGSVVDGRLQLAADAEGPLVKGLVRLLCAVYDGEKVEDVLVEEPVLWSELGFQKLLSPTRQAGLAAVRGRILQLCSEDATGR